MNGINLCLMATFERCIRQRWSIFLDQLAKPEADVTCAETDTIAGEIEKFATKGISIFQSALPEVYTAADVGWRS